MSVNIYMSDCLHVAISSMYYVTNVCVCILCIIVFLCFFLIVVGVYLLSLWNHMSDLPLVVSDVQFSSQNYTEAKLQVKWWFFIMLLSSSLPPPPLSLSLPFLYYFFFYLGTWGTSDLYSALNLFGISGL